MTKTPEQLAARRARVKQMMDNGEVETDAIRRARKKAQQHQEELQSRADAVLAGLKPSSGRESIVQRISSPQVAISAVPEATRTIPAGKKVDDLAAQADKVLQSILSGEN